MLWTRYGRTAVDLFAPVSPLVLPKNWILWLTLGQTVFSYSGNTGQSPAWQSQVAAGAPTLDGEAVVQGFGEAPQ